MLGLDVLYQGLLLMIPFPVFSAIVGEFGTAARLLVHVPGSARSQMLAAFGTEIMGHTLMDDALMPLGLEDLCDRCHNKPGEALVQEPQRADLQQLLGPARRTQESDPLGPAQPPFLYPSELPF